ncbi:MAG: hypothetical protein ACR2M3_15240, partial [Thermomicrobiales bacterium]
MQESSVGAFTNTGTYSSAANSYNGPQDGNPDGIQGYTAGQNNAGVFGRNNDSNGIGVFGQTAKGAGVSGHGEGGPGVYGESVSGQAIIGNSLAPAPIAGVTTTGVTGKSLTDAGVYGFSGAPAGTANGVGVYGTSTNAVGVSGKAANATGVMGVTANASNTPAVSGVSYANTNYDPAQLGGMPGVAGQSGSGVGVQGTSTSNAGLIGQSGSGYGVYGASTTSYAVLGISTTSHGVVGYGGSGYAGIVGGLGPSGAGFAGLFAGPVTVQGPLNVSTPVGTNTHSITGYGNSNGYGGVLGLASPSVTNSIGIYGVASAAGTWAGVFNGPFVVYGGNKNAAVPHPDGSHRLLYCLEATEAWFEDFGEGTLAGGTVTVALDGDFAAIVETSTLYVFLTPHVAGNALAVTARSATGFTVTEGGGGKGSGGFTYRVVAKRKDVASPRLAKVTLPMGTAPTPPKVVTLP